MDKDSIEEEYKIWKKNSPYLYDSVMSYELEWPSLTVSWFPDKIQEPNKNYTTQRLLLGTHTSEGEPNNLLIAQIKFPSPSAAAGEKISETKNFSTESIVSGGFGQGGSIGKFEIVQAINHPSEVNKARFMPQNPDIIATKTHFKNVLVFDRTRHFSKAMKEEEDVADLTLSGHSQEGYGLDWNCFREGDLLSCADDGLICYWNISKPKTKKDIAPIRTFDGHGNSIVEDVKWHRTNQNLFASAGDDSTVKLWDSRKPQCTNTISAHDSEVNSVSFSPHRDFLFLSGSKDKTVKLWDMRNLNARLHVLEGHKEQIFTVEWSPLDEAVVASSGADRRVNVWDLKRIGREQAPEDAQDGPPELVFVHGGHTDKVSEFCFAPTNSWTVASVAENNILQVWQVSKDVYSEEAKVVEDDDLE